MQILVINCGSSSVKSEIIDSKTGNRLLTMQIERVSEATPLLQFSEEEPIECPEAGHEKALRFAFPKLMEKIDTSQLKGVGHRVVHGGDAFDEAEIIDEAVEKKIEALYDVAPLHNPINMTGIRIAKEFFGNVPHIAVFDTAFHRTLPARAKKYALPTQLMQKHKIQRYGFHGTSHQYVAQQAARYLKTDIRQLKIITCHLGNGASVCAVEYGRSVETSMGMTPLEGLVMGTRSGDVDPGILIHLMEQENLSAKDLNQLLNKESGLKGISCSGADMRDIEESASTGNEECRKAIQIYTHRIKKYIGAYAGLMGGVDAIVFTAGVGENSATIRHRAAQRLEYLGAFLEEEKNRTVSLTHEQPTVDISLPQSRCKILVVKTDEQLAIAQQASKIINEQRKVHDVKVIPIAISARHVHLTQETVEKLFGEGYQLTEFKPLSQPGQFACNETVTIVGPKNQIEKVRILGPVRSKNQVEISRTDEFFLGIDAPIRESGHTENTPGITLVGEKGKVDLKEGVICAWRHIHMHPDDANVFGVQDKDIVEIRIENSERSLTFGNVLIRVSPKYKLEMHIDTDEANAAELSPGAVGALIDTAAEGHLVKRRSNLDEVKA
ncbi:MAG: acetate/propionate family kinase [Thermonemataceae bacterium]